MRQWAVKDQVPRPSAPVPSAPIAGSFFDRQYSSIAGAEDKVPWTWPSVVSVGINGRSPSFPQQFVLLGSLTKLWHQLKVSRNFAKLPLAGDQSFGAIGAVKALSKCKQKNELVVDVGRFKLVTRIAGSFVLCAA